MWTKADQQTRLPPSPLFAPLAAVSSGRLLTITLGVTHVFSADFVSALTGAAESRSAPKMDFVSSLIAFPDRPNSNQIYSFQCESGK